MRYTVTIHYEDGTKYLDWRMRRTLFAAISAAERLLLCRHAISASVQDLKTKRRWFVPHEKAASILELEGASYDTPE